MTTIKSRTDRGKRTQLRVAEYLAAHGWPFAEAVGAGRVGADVTGTPGLAIEVKARADWSPLGWMRQAERQNRVGLRLVVQRCNGQGEGPGAAADYLAVLRLADLVDLLHAAGYGSPQPVTEAPCSQVTPPASQAHRIPGSPHSRVQP